MKIAIIFFGLVQRSLAHVSNSIHCNLVRPLEESGEVRLFYHTWKTGSLTNPRAGEFGIECDHTDIDQYLPGALGKSDDEAQFCQLIDWDPIYRANPLRSICSDEDAAKVTIRNVILTLHSLEAAFDILRNNMTEPPDLLVATRADLRFLKPLEIPATIQPWTVYAPSFHGWGGVNDRLAFGDFASMEIYSHRTSFFDGWMLNPNNRNPEWVLAKWLERNRLRINLIDCPFQRVRADGSVFALDNGIGEQKIVESMNIRNDQTK